MKNFIISDNQYITKAGIIFLLTQNKDNIDSIIEATNKSELICELRTHPQAIIILDYSLFDFSGINELIALHEHFAGTRWLLFSEELSIEFIRQALYSSDCFSIVMKDSSEEEIRIALDTILHGQRFICNEVSNMLLNGNVTKNVHEEENKLLTTTEKAILKEIASGKTTKEIAAERNLSFHTVNSHRKNIFRKLGVNNVHEATRYAVRAGIIDLAEYFI